mmetsp:Transcript_70968/g.205731  ORF Transcript_70968/g.205731 Transcript_70968/m.205731 type:complete len:326 (-) Transcript_70968:41-1018(-)
MPPPAPGAAALSQTKGSHPTMRLDSFLRSTDAGYRHAEPQTHGDRFIRKMATYGNIRPSVSFTSEARVGRPMKDHAALDMSNLPMPIMDPRGEDKEGTLCYPQPPKEIDDSFVQMYKNHTLMLPSERYKEHLQMKEAYQQFLLDRENLFRYRKRMQVLERHYPNGVMGLDGPLHPDTQLYAQRRGHILGQEAARQQHAINRREHLKMQQDADDAITGRHYGSDPNLRRSQDLGIQRKRIDPQLHPARFLDTHERLFPQHSPTWDPERAAAIRSHETRGRAHNLITGADNSLEFKVAKRWDAPPLPGMPNIKSHPGYVPPSEAGSP